MNTKNLFKGVLIAALAVLTPVNVCGQDSLSKPQSQNTLNLDLDQAIKIALSKNPTIKVADMEIERASYAKKEVIGNLFPSIGSSAGYTRTIAKQVMAGLDPSLFTAGITQMLLPIYEALGIPPPQSRR